MQFKEKPFGLSLALRVFNKLTKEVTTRLFWVGVDVLMYSDDWLIAAPSREDALAMVATTQQVI